MERLSGPNIASVDTLPNAILVAFGDGECAIYSASLLFATLPMAQKVENDIGDEYDTEQN
jgi:hypothetical protein